MTSLLPILIAAATLAPAETGTLGSTQFNFVGAASITAMPADNVPAVPRAVPACREMPNPSALDGLYLLAQTARRSLFSSTETREEHQAFLDMWLPILRKGGFVPGEPEWEHRFSVLPYQGIDNLVVRRFLADPFQFAPKGEGDKLANMRMVFKALETSGHPVMASYLIEDDALLPTYALYYMTTYAEKPEREVRVRILKKEGADTAILERAGVKVLQQHEDFITVYIGREVGMVWRGDNTLEDLQKKIAGFKKFIAEQGGTFIEAKIVELEPDDYWKYFADIYFFL